MVSGDVEIECTKDLGYNPKPFSQRKTGSLIPSQKSRFCWLRQEDSPEHRALSSITKEPETLMAPASSNCNAESPEDWLCANKIRDTSVLLSEALVASVSLYC